MASRKPQQSKEHRFSQANLSAYIDNQLAPKELARVARHLEECDACRRELAELRRTVALVSQTPRLHAPRSFALPQAMQPAQARQRRWEGLFAFARTAAVVASALMVILFAGDMALTFGWKPAASAPSAQRVAAVVETHVVEESAKKESVVLLENAPASEAPVPQIEVASEPAVAAAAEESAIEEPASDADAAEAPLGVQLSADAATPTSAVGMGGGGAVASVASASEMPAGEKSLPETLPATSMAADRAAAPPVEEVAVTETPTLVPPTPEPTQPPPTSLPTLTPSETTANVAAAAPAQQPTEIAPAAELPLVRTPYQQVWGWLRTLWILAAGTLLILLGVLVWSAYRKRI